jgi:hypothetical protein
MQRNKSDPGPAVGYQGQRQATARAQPPKWHHRRRFAFGRSRSSVVQRIMVQATFMPVLEFCPTRGVCAARYHNEPIRGRKSPYCLSAPPQHWVNTDNTVQCARKCFGFTQLRDVGQCKTCQQREPLSPQASEPCPRENLFGSQASKGHCEDSLAISAVTVGRQAFERAEGNQRPRVLHVTNSTIPHRCAGSLQLPTGYCATGMSRSTSFQSKSGIFSPKTRSRIDYRGFR